MAWRYADCESCGNVRGTVVFTQPMVAIGGGARDIEDDIFFYLVDSETVITVDT